VDYPIEAIGVANPAAGVNFAYTADDDIMVVTFAFQLVTSATVANRRFKLTVEDPSGNVIARYESGADQAASLTWLHHSERGGTSDAAAINNWLGTFIPEEGIQMAPGYVLRSVVDNIQSGDQLSAIKLGIGRIGRSPS
jgi:hypothetical protein